MIVGLLIIIIFPFIYFYTQINNFNQKTGAIKKAINEEKEVYIDPLTGKMHWTENGEQVIWTEILSVEQNIPKGCIVGDKVLRGVKTDKIYKNQNYEDFVAHVQRQINNGEIWCWERHSYNGDRADYNLKYHIKEKFLYYFIFDWNTHNYCIVYNDTKKKEIISYKKYKELGGCDWRDMTRGYN